MGCDQTSWVLAKYSLKFINAPPDRWIALKSVETVALGFRGYRRGFAGRRVSARLKKHTPKKKKKRRTFLRDEPRVVPLRTREDRWGQERLQCVYCLRAAPCGKPQPRGPRVLGVLAASLVSLLTSCPSRAEYHLLSFWGPWRGWGVPLGWETCPFTF